MNKQLILVHGRSQQGKPPRELKDTWVAAWEEGLRLHGLKIPIGDADIKFPYYGDTLMDLVDGKETPLPVTIHGSLEGDVDDGYGAFLAAILREIQVQVPISEQRLRDSTADEPFVTPHGVANWPWIHAMLKAIDQHVPGASSAVLSTVTRDAYLYLTRSGIRDDIDKGVLQGFASMEPAVVVGHSLGSVVTYNLLRREGTAARWNVPLFVTIGSPLGVQKIRQMLQPLSHPGCIERWFNALDERDVVALYPLDSNRFGVEPPVENLTSVQNDTDNHHGITGYLKDPQVAKRIYDALV